MDADSLGHLLRLIYKYTAAIFPAMCGVQKDISTLRKGRERSHTVKNEWDKWTAENNTYDGIV